MVNTVGEAALEREELKWEEGAPIRLSDGE
jgi:hypothetical protein